MFCSSSGLDPHPRPMTSLFLPCFIPLWDLPPEPLCYDEDAGWVSPVEGSMQGLKNMKRERHQCISSCFLYRIWVPSKSRARLKETFVHSHVPSNRASMPSSSLRQVVPLPDILEFECLTFLCSFKTPTLSYFSS